MEEYKTECEMAGEIVSNIVYMYTCNVLVAVVTGPAH